MDALCKSTSSILSSGLTTVIGFLALVLMQFRIGPDLGLALAKGVDISLITVFVFMPALILSTYKLMDRTKHRAFVPGFHGFGKVVRRIMLLMVCLFFVMIVPAYLASNSNDYYFGSSRIFGSDTKLGQDTLAIEEVFGENDTYVLLVPKEEMATQTKLSDELNELKHVKSIISYVDLAGEGVSTYDLMDTVMADMVKVNLLAIGAVFLVLLLTLQSISLPVILVLSIETAIWINLSFPYFLNARIFYIAYLIISSIQLGATVDYAILMTDRYKENRQTLGKKEAVVETLANVSVSILTSGSVLTVVGFLLGYFSSNQLLAQLGIFIGRGALCSLFIVLFVLPGLLYLFDRLVIRDKKKGLRNCEATEQIQACKEFGKEAVSGKGGSIK